MNSTITIVLWLITIIPICLMVILITGCNIYFRRLSADWRDLLRQFQSYSGTPAIDGSLPEFSYSEASAPELVVLRKKYNLDRIAEGKGEIERIVALMKWVHSLCGHTSDPEYVPPFNSIGLIRNYGEKKIRMNCYMHAIILNEVYLAEGFKSRIVRLEPYEVDCNGRHWVVIVYSQEAGKWIMMDADMCGYLRDENKNYLGLAEIRGRLANGKKLLVNKDGGVVKFLGSYPAYLSKFLFRFTCSQLSNYGQEESRAGGIFWELVPKGYQPPGLEAIEISKEDGSITKRISDASTFWVTP